MINLNHLRIFFHAAKNQNFTIAARELFITQPAVSAQIKSLENDCNLTFFKKKGRKIHLTDEGKHLFNYAQKIFEYEHLIENAIEELRELKCGLLRLGTTKAYARYFMPFMISTFREKYPGIKIQLNEGSSLEMIYSLLDFKNEIAVIARAEDHPEVTFVPFSQEEIVLILAPDHPFARNSSISLQELAKEPIIMKEAGSGTRKRINDLFSLSGLTPNILMETGNAEFIKQLVQRGEGISFIVKEAVKNELKEKTLATIKIEGHRLELDVSVAYLKNQQLSPPARAFLSILDMLSPKDLTLKGIGSLMAKLLAARKRKTEIMKDSKRKSK
ncbi:MAG: LysR family transcriptional regulator [Thermodesulfobacteriota bacterium]